MIKNKDIDNGKAFDWGNASTDYAKYRDIYPDEFYNRIINLGLCVNKQEVLDLGTGTGVLPRNMYKFGAKWTGTDISENQIIEAKRMANENNMNIKFFKASAEETGLPDKSFDVITACQCFFYFDIVKVLPEIVRILKQNGRLLILYMVWLPFESDIALGSEKLVLKYNPDWTGCGIKRYEVQAPEWSKELFDCNGCYSYTVDVPFTRESWHGRIIACRGIGASSLSDNEIDSFKKEHWEYMLLLPKTFNITHYVTMLDLKVK